MLLEWSLTAIQHNFLILLSSCRFMLLAVAIFHTKVVDTEHFWMSPARIAKISLVGDKPNRRWFKIVLVDSRTQLIEALSITLPHGVRVSIGIEEAQPWERITTASVTPSGWILVPDEGTVLLPDWRIFMISLPSGWEDLNRRRLWHCNKL